MVAHFGPIQYPLPSTTQQLRNLWNSTKGLEIQALPVNVHPALAGSLLQSGITTLKRGFSPRETNRQPSQQDQVHLCLVLQAWDRITPPSGSQDHTSLVRHLLPAHGLLNTPGGEGLKDLEKGCKMNTLRGQKNKKQQQQHLLGPPA